MIKPTFRDNNGIYNPISSSFFITTQVNCISASELSTAVRLHVRSYVLLQRPRQTLPYKLFDLLFACLGLL